MNGDDVFTVHGPPELACEVEALAAHPDRDNIEVSVSFYELYKDSCLTRWLGTWPCL